MPYLSIGEFDFSLLQICLALGAYVAVCALVLAYVPIWAVPDPTIADNMPPSEKLEIQNKIFELRGKVRTSLMPFCVGVGVIFAAVTSLQNIRKNEDDFKTAKAHLFSGAIAEIFDEEAKPNKRIEKLHTLSFLSRNDPTYYRAIFEALSDFVRNPSSKVCAFRDWRLAADAAPPREVSVAMQIFRNREVEKDQKTRFNFENACLIGFDARDENSDVKGLMNVRLANAVLVASDFTKANLSGADLSDVRAGDYLSPTWTSTAQIETHIAAKSDDRSRNNDIGELARKRTVVRFIGADLSNTNFSRANLAGADFSGANLASAKFDHANIARANFQGAKNIPFDNFKTLCVGQPTFTEDEIKSQQPYFADGDIKKIGKIQKCGAGSIR